MKQYKAIFLDWDDTIGDFHGAAKLALEEMYSKYELSRIFSTHDEFVSLYKPHNLDLWALYADGKVTKDFLRVDRFLYPLEHGSNRQECSILDLRELAVQMSEDFLSLTTSYFKLIPGADDLVRYLAQKYPLTIVTNGFVEVQYEKFEKSGLKDYLTHVVLSEEVGCQKPNAEIFHHALRLNKVSADEVVMIGDSLGSDILGAMNAGIDQIWVKFDNRTSDIGEPTYTVDKLEDIKNIL